MEHDLGDSEPVPLERWPVGAGSGELAALRHLHDAGLPVAPTVVVPAAAESSFYRWNRLPQRLADLFEPVASLDPDEEDVEDLVPLAGRLIDQHALLDQWIDLFYDAMLTLPHRLRVRRPGEAGAATVRGRPALLALRATWRADWEFEAVMQRLHAHGSVALAARPVLLHAEPVAPAASDLLARVRGEVEALEAHVDTRGAVARLVVEPSAARPGGTNARG